jgi:hypothetical protein
MEIGNAAQYRSLNCSWQIQVERDSSKSTRYSLCLSKLRELIDRLRETDRLNDPSWHLGYKHDSERHAQR